MGLAGGGCLGLSDNYVAVRADEPCGATIDVLVSDVGLPGTMNGDQTGDLAHLNRPEIRALFRIPHRLKHVLDSRMLSGTWPFLIKDEVSVLQAFLTPRGLASLPPPGPGKE